MRIAIDIDDTLTESFAYFQPYVAEYFGADAAELRRQNISYSNLPDAWKQDEVGFCKAYYDRIVPDTPFRPDAARAIQTLKERGHSILILTGRTTAFYTDPYQTTAEELKRGGIAYDQLICTLDKGRACAGEQIDLLIDDLPSNCDDAVKHGIAVILFTSPANRDVPTRHPRASSWNEVLELVR